LRQFFLTSNLFLEILENTELNIKWFGLISKELNSKGQIFVFMKSFVDIKFKNLPKQNYSQLFASFSDIFASFLLH
jgi:hypothetical protein